MTLGWINDGGRKGGSVFEKFLVLWKDAAPGIAEVEDARKRLGSLKNTSS
jgi:hypothetical protein